MSFLFIVSTCICCLAHILPTAIKYVINWILSESEHERQLKNSALALEREMNKISMVDEFAKYSKLQRKYVKSKEEHKKQIAERVALRDKARFFFTYAAKIFNWLIIVLMVRQCRREAVVLLPKGALWPLQDFFSWPGIYTDSISLVTWVGINCMLRNQ